MCLEYTLLNYTKLVTYVSEHIQCLDAIIPCKDSRVFEDTWVRQGDGCEKGVLRWWQD